MPFREAIKQEAKKKAHYKCCICQSFEFIHVHHIIPEAEDGPDTLENAAPLCTRCHDAYGGNPTKRKWIQEKRDFWWELCERTLTNEDLEELKKTYNIIEGAQDGRITNVEEKITELQKGLESYTCKLRDLTADISRIPRNQQQDTFTQIGSVSGTISGTSTAMVHLGAGVYTNPTCPKCGSRIGLYVSNQAGPPTCPNCGTAMQ